MLWFRGALPQEVAFPRHFVCKAGCSPNFFEHLVVDLLVKMGHADTRKDAGRAVGKSGDEDIDGIINEDRLGLEVVYIQAKQWNYTVGRALRYRSLSDLYKVEMRGKALHYHFQLLK